MTNEVFERDLATMRAEMRATHADVLGLCCAVAALIDASPERERIVTRLREQAASPPPGAGQADMPAGLATVLNILS